MKFSLLSLIFILGSCFGNPHYKIGRIVGGEEFPYVVSLKLNGDHICGGSIISNNYILTVSTLNLLLNLNKGTLNFHF